MLLAREEGTLLRQDLNEPEGIQPMEASPLHIHTHTGQEAPPASNSTVSPILGEEHVIGEENISGTMDHTWPPAREGRILIRALLGQEKAVVFQVGTMSTPPLLQTHLVLQDWDSL